MSDDRAAFEKWVAINYLPRALERSRVVPEQYRDTRTSEQWLAWQAGMRAGIERAAGVCEGVGATDNGLRTWQRCCAAVRALLEGKT